MSLEICKNATQKLSKYNELEAVYNESLSEFEHNKKPHQELLGVVTSFIWNVDWYFRQLTTYNIAVIMGGSQLSFNFGKRCKEGLETIEKINWNNQNANEIYPDLVNLTTVLNSFAGGRTFDIQAQSYLRTQQTNAKKLQQIIYIKTDALKADSEQIKTERDAYILTRTEQLIVDSGECPLLLAEEEDNIAWRKATTLNTVESYETYLTSFPEGKNANNAIRAIKGINERIEADAYASALTKGTIAAIEDYLEAYPEGLYVADALTEIQNIEDNREAELWQQVQVTNNIAAYEFYLSEYPDGNFSESAESQIRKFEFAEATGATVQVVQQQPEVIDIPVVEVIPGPTSTKVTDTFIQPTSEPTLVMPEVQQASVATKEAFSAGNFFKSPTGQYLLIGTGVVLVGSITYKLLFK